MSPLLQLSTPAPRSWLPPLQAVHRVVQSRADPLAGWSMSRATGRQARLNELLRETGRAPHRAISDSNVQFRDCLTSVPLRPTSAHQNSSARKMPLSCRHIFHPTKHFIEFIASTLHIV